MVTRCKNLEQMLREGKIPIKGGWTWVDAYNLITQQGITGAITVRVDPSNQRFVMNIYEEPEDPTHTGLQPQQP